LALLESAKPYDRANASVRLLRAEILLRGGRLNDAASEFETVASLPFSEPIGFRWTSYTVNLFAPLAEVGLARSRRLAGEISDSRRAYQAFLAAWKDADPDIPILREAKVHYAKLQ